MIHTPVPLKAIDLLDDRFCISYMADRRRLTKSIRQIGLIHPVVLRPKPPQERYLIVSGFQRVLACCDLNIDPVPSIVYQPHELSDRQALLTTVHQTVTNRSLNLVEKSLVLRKLISVGNCSEDKIINDIMPLLDLEPNRKIWASVARLWELTDDLKSYIAHHDLSLQNALHLLQFNKEDQQALHKLISPLKLGTNRLKEFLLLIDEICHRDGVPADAIINSEITAILTDPDRPTPQKADAIRGHLRRRRYPEMISLERGVQEKLKQLKLPSNLSLTPPPFLEGDRLTVHFEFKGKEELDRVIQNLTEISASEALAALLDML